MSRTCKPVVLTSDERKQLELLAAGDDQALALRAKIVLQCSETNNNQEVASILNVNKNTVHLWREAYLTAGIDGLVHTSSPGRPASHVSEDLIRRIRELMKSDESLQVSDIAKALGVTTYAVRKAMREANMGETRNRSWTIQTVHSDQPVAGDIIGVFISHDEVAIVGCHAQYGMLLSQGSVETRNRKLADDFEASPDATSLLSVIVGFTMHQCDGPMGKAPVMGEYLSTLMSQLPSSPSLSYHVFYFSEQFTKYTGQRLSGITFHKAVSRDACFLEAFNWAYTEFILKQEDGIKLIGSMNRLWQTPVVGEAFCWKRSISTFGTEEASLLGFTAEMLWDHPLMQSVNDQILQMIDESARPKDDNQILLHILISALDQKGISLQQAVLSDAALPDASTFSFDTLESFMDGLNSAEPALAALSAEVGKAIMKLYLDEVKKNTTSSDPQDAAR